MKDQENKYIFYFWGSGHIFSSCKTTPKAVIIGVYKKKQVQLQWTTGIYKWKLQTKIFLIVRTL